MKLQRHLLKKVELLILAHVMTLLLTLINRESVCIVDRDHRKHAIMVEIPKASSAIGRDMGPIKVLHTTKEGHFKESIFPSFFVFVSF